MTTVFMEIEISESTLRRFLLGDADDDESAAIGARLFDDESFAAKLEFAEDALIEDYLTGELSDDDRLLFDTVFLTTPERQKRFGEIRLLMLYARQNRTTESSSAVETNVAAATTAATGWRGYFRPLTLVIFAAVLIVCAAFLAWFVVFGDNRTQAEIDYQARNQKQLDLSATNSDLPVATLSYQSFSDQSDVPTLFVTGPSEAILFRLPLPSGTDSKAAFNIRLVLNGSVVFRQSDLPSYQTGAGREIRLLVPRAILQVSSAEIVVTPDDLKYRFRLM